MSEAQFPPATLEPGLCGACVHHRWTSNRRGSRFLMCRRSVRESCYSKYPPLPVRECPGYEAQIPDDPCSEPRANRL